MSTLVNCLKKGKPQIVVAYGTSLTAGGVWVSQLQQALNEAYPGLATVINSGQGDMTSRWGVENLESRVIQKNPDTVFIEFAINDAFLEFKISVAEARGNLENMIDRILKWKPTCEIILMTMNPPIGIHLERGPQIKDYYQLYRIVAKDRNLKLIDHYPNWEHILNSDQDLFDRYVPDGLHPWVEGCHQVITPMILKELGLLEEQGPHPAVP